MISSCKGLTLRSESAAIHRLTILGRAGSDELGGLLILSRFRRPSSKGQDYPRTGTVPGDTVMMVPTGNVENTCCAVQSLVDTSPAVWAARQPGRSRRARSSRRPPVIGFLKQPIAHVRGRCAARISPERNSSIQSKFCIANRWAMKSLIACQNEACRGLSSASRLTALSSSSSAARCTARFVPTGVRKSRILSSAVGSLFAANSDDRARDRKASMNVSRRILMTMPNAHIPLGVHYTALVQTARWKRGMMPRLHE